MRCWAAILLPGLLLRALIPVGFMPMFGPGLAVSMMLCPAYAPVPASVSGTAGPSGPEATADASMDMSAMDMSLGTPATGQQRSSQSMQDTDAGVLTPATGSVPGHGSDPDHQDHTLCPYAASAMLGAPPAHFIAAISVPLVAEYTLFAPQIAYFQLAPRAQSARGPPHIPS